MVREPSRRFCATFLSWLASAILWPRRSLRREVSHVRAAQTHSPRALSASLLMAAQRRSRPGLSGVSPLRHRIRVRHREHAPDRTPGASERPGRRAGEPHHKVAGRGFCEVWVPKSRTGCGFWTLGRSSSRRRGSSRTRGHGRVLRGRDSFFGYPLYIGGCGRVLAWLRHLQSLLGSHLAFA